MSSSFFDNSTMVFIQQMVYASRNGTHVSDDDYRRIDELYAEIGHLRWLNNPVADMYRDYVNNFVTASAFAGHYGISIELAEQIIKEGREVHERNVKR